MRGCGRLTDHAPGIIAIRVQRAARAIIAPTDGSNLWHKTWPLRNSIAARGRGERQIQDWLTTLQPAQGPALISLRDVEAGSQEPEVWVEILRSTVAHAFSSRMRNFVRMDFEPGAQEPPPVE